MNKSKLKARGKKIREIIRANHCRYCGRPDEEGALSDRCNDDIDYATEQIISLLHSATQRARKEEKRRIKKAILLIDDLTESKRIIREELERI